MPGPPRRPEGDDDGLVDARLVRPVDLLDARLTAPGCTVERDGDGAFLVAAGDAASLVLHLPPQHLGERAWPAGGTAGALSAHRAAAPTRVVFALPDGVRVPFTLSGVLAVLPTLELRVAPHATPAVVGGELRPRPGWLDDVLVPGWQRLADGADDAVLADLVLGTGHAAAVASTALHDVAARVLLHAGAARLVRGHAGT
ncbi:hypothetical protein ICW40_04765, partial [Actinotalea ferrariae]|uniref:hypothetical protein n=1 Tax=Actinotalea ferrariae TaxID=1386098 RepID=UPI001C8BE973